MYENPNTNGYIVSPDEYDAWYAAYVCLRLVTDLCNGDLRTKDYSARIDASVLSPADMQDVYRRAVELWPGA